MSSTKDGAVFQARKTFDAKTLSYRVELVETGRVSVTPVGKTDAPGDEPKAPAETKKGIVAKAKAVSAKRKAKKNADA